MLHKQIDAETLLLAQNALSSLLINNVGELTYLVAGKLVDRLHQENGLREMLVVFSSKSGYYLLIFFIFNLFPFGHIQGGFLSSPLSNP